MIRTTEAERVEALALPGLRTRLVDLEHDDAIVTMTLREGVEPGAEQDVLADALCCQEVLDEPGASNQSESVPCRALRMHVTTLLPARLRLSDGEADLVDQDVRSGIDLHVQRSPQRRTDGTAVRLGVHDAVGTRDLRIASADQQVGVVGMVVEPLRDKPARREHRGALAAHVSHRAGHEHLAQTPAALGRIDDRVRELERVPSRHRSVLGEAHDATVVHELVAVLVRPIDHVHPHSVHLLHRGPGRMLTESGRPQGADAPDQQIPAVAARPPGPSRRERTAAPRAQVLRRRRKMFDRAGDPTASA